MAEEYVYTTADIERYRPIALAPEFAQKKDAGGLEETIMQVLKNIEVREPDRKDVASCLDPEKFIKVHTAKYQKALQSQKLKDLRMYYKDLFEEIYNKDNLSKVDKVFNSETTYGEILEKYMTAGEIIESKTKNFSKEQKEKAEKELKELNKIVDPINSFEALNVNALREPITKDSLKQRLNDAYKEEKIEEKVK